MAERGTRREFEDLGDAGVGRHDGRSFLSHSFLRAGGVGGLFALLAACNAHERATVATATPTPPAAVAVASTLPDGMAPSVVARPHVAVASMAQPAKPVVVTAKAPASERKIGRAGGGLASWYGDRFHGRPTANGERFDMGGFTAAHRTMPLPSYARVTNVSNGRSIVVRVNDRGPFHGSRVIDVSRRAADVLGFRSSGVGNVRIDYVGRAPEGRRDDGRLLASYQEFGRPTAPPGMQMAAMAPVSDGELAAEASGGGGAFAVASAAVTTSVSAVRSSASAVASRAKAAVRTILPGAPSEPRPPVTVVAGADSAPIADTAAAPPTAYAAAQPLLATAPAAITSPRSATTKRVIPPNAEPVLASSAPELRSTLGAQTPAPGVDVSSRISAGFDSFGGSATTVRAGGSTTFDGLR